MTAYKQVPRSLVDDYRSRGWFVEDDYADCAPDYPLVLMRRGDRIRDRLRRIDWAGILCLVSGLITGALAWIVVAHWAAQLWGSL